MSTSSFNENNVYQTGNEDFEWDWETKQSWIKI